VQGARVSGGSPGGRKRIHADPLARDEDGFCRRPIRISRGLGQLPGRRRAVLLDDPGELRDAKGIPVAGVDGRGCSPRTLRELTQVGRTSGLSWGRTLAGRRAGLVDQDVAKGRTARAQVFAGESERAVIVVLRQRRRWLRLGI